MSAIDIQKKANKLILKELQINADRRIADIETQVGLPRSTIHNRIQKLKKAGIISSIKATVNPKALGLEVCALIHIVVSSKKGVHAIAKRLGKQRNVQEVYITAGVFDIVAKARFTSNSELSSFIFDSTNGIKSWEGILRTESMICLESIKEHGILE